MQSQLVFAPPHEPLSSLLKNKDPIAIKTRMENNIIIANKYGNIIQ